MYNGFSENPTKILRDNSWNRTASTLGDMAENISVTTVLQVILQYHMPLNYSTVVNVS